MGSRDMYQEKKKKEMELKNLDRASKEIIAVAVFNGGVYETEIKTN